MCAVPLNEIQIYIYAFISSITSRRLFTQYDPGYCVHAAITSQLILFSASSLHAAPPTRNSPHPQPPPSLIQLIYSGALLRPTQAAVGSEVGGLMGCIVSLWGSICAAHETPSCGVRMTPPHPPHPHSLVNTPHPTPSSQQLKCAQHCENGVIMHPCCSLSSSKNHNRHNKRVIFDTRNSASGLSSVVNVLWKRRKRYYLNKNEKKWKNLFCLQRQ